MSEKNIKYPIVMTDSELNELADNIANLVNTAKSQLTQTINTTLITTY